MSYFLHAVLISVVLGPHLYIRDVPAKQGRIPRVTAIQFGTSCMELLRYLRCDSPTYDVRLALGILSMSAQTYGLVCFLCICKLLMESLDIVSKYYCFQSFYSFHHSDCDSLYSSPVCTMHN